MSEQQTGRSSGPAARGGGPRSRTGVPTSAQPTVPPGVVLISGDLVVTGQGMRHRAPQSGPAGDMLDRLWEAVGNNGLVMIGPGEPTWSYLVRDASGWKISGGPSWFTATRGQTCLRLVLMHGIAIGNDPLMGPDYPTIASRHQRFANLTGVPFFADGGTTSALLMEQLVRPKGPAALRAWRDEAAPRLTEPSWLGPWQTGEYGQTMRLDKNAYYLCAANSAQLPVGGLKHTGAGADPVHNVGVWRINAPANPDPGHLPSPVGGRIAPGTLIWVAHPTMELLAELGLSVTVTDSWTAPRTQARRLLAAWYERLRDARNAARTYDDDDAVAIQRAIKDTYSRGIGCLDRENRRWHRPDWRAMIYAQARCNMYRTLRRAGLEERRWPAAVRTDSVMYEGSEPPAAFRMGDGMGEWKVVSQ